MAGRNSRRVNKGREMLHATGQEMPKTSSSKANRVNVTSEVGKDGRKRSYVSDTKTGNRVRGTAHSKVAKTAYEGRLVDTGSGKKIVNKVSTSMKVKPKGSVPKSLPKTQTKTTPVKKNPSNVSTKVQSKKLPATTKGRAVTKTSPTRGVKNMGKANVVLKKALTAAKNAAKSTPFVAVGAGVIGASMERTSHLASTGKLSTPMDRFGDKAIYGDRLTKTKTTQMPLPKSKPGLSTKANEKAVKAIKPKAGSMSGKVVKPKVTAPAKKSTVTPKKAVKAPKKPVTTSYKPQNSKGTQMTKKRMDSGYKNPAKAPKPSTPKPKKPVNNTVNWLMDGDW